MQPVDTVHQVFAAIQRVKSNAPAYCTNFFPGPQKLQGWIEHGELFCEPQPEAAFFFRRDHDFWRIYFCAASREALERELTGLPDANTKPLVMDVIEPETAVESLLPVLETTGFRLHSRLCRLARQGSPGPGLSASGDPQPVYAGNEDVQAVADLLDDSFDYYAEQLPAIHEIEAAINHRQILVMKQLQTLAGLLFFETQGVASTIRYWTVAEEFRARRYGSALMRAYLAAHAAVRRFNLWVKADNQPAILRYQHYGYAPDKLVDWVLVNGTISK